jgi:threonine synthase
VALAALEKLVGRGEIRNQDRVVVVSTASGLKFTDFKVAYHEGKLPQVPSPRYANTPVMLPNQYDAVRDAVRRSLGT